MGKGHQVSWPREKRGVRSEGSLPRPQVGIVWGRKGSEDLGAPWVPGSSLREAGLAPSPPPASEAHSAEAAQGSGGQPSYSLPGLWPGVWRPQPEPGVQGLSHRVPQWLTGAWEGGRRGADTPLALFQSCLLSMDLAAECAPDNPRSRQGAPAPRPPATATCAVAGSRTTGNGRGTPSTRPWPQAAPPHVCWCGGGRASGTTAPLGGQ